MVLPTTVCTLLWLTASGITLKLSVIRNFRKVVLRPELMSVIEVLKQLG